MNLQTVHCMIFSSIYSAVIMYFIFSEKEIGKYLSFLPPPLFFRKARGPQVNCTFLLYDYQSHHFQKIDSSAALLFFTHSRNTDTLCHDYYHILSILLNHVIIALVFKYQEMETVGFYHWYSEIKPTRAPSNVFYIQQPHLKK